MNIDKKILSILFAGAAATSAQAQVISPCYGGSLSVQVISIADPLANLDLSGDFLYAVNLTDAAAESDASVFPNGFQQQRTVGGLAFDAYDPFVDDQSVPFDSGLVISGDIGDPGNTFLPGEGGRAPDTIDTELNFILGSFAWESLSGADNKAGSSPAAPTNTITFSELEIGQAYKLQVLFFENFWTARKMTVTIDGFLAVEDFNAATVPGGIVQQTGSVVAFEFVASDTTMTIDIDADRENGTDTNYTWSALTLEQTDGLANPPHTCFNDCNSNEQDDRLDITSGVSLDFDNNGIPDECVTPIQGPRGIVNAGAELLTVDLATGVFTPQFESNDFSSLWFDIEHIDGRFYSFWGAYNGFGVRLFDVNPFTGEVTDPVDGTFDNDNRYIDVPGTGNSEGDSAYNPDTGLLYATTLIDRGPNNGLAQEDLFDDIHYLYTFDVETGNHSIIGELPSNAGDWAGLAFDCDGRLWVLEVFNDFLIELDPVNGNALQFIPLSGADIGSHRDPNSNSNMAGMDWDPTTRTMYIVDGDWELIRNPDGSINEYRNYDRLYSVDLTTGQLTLINETVTSTPRVQFGIPGGIAILAVDRVNVLNFLLDLDANDPSTDVAAPALEYDSFDVLQYLNDAVYMNNGGCID